MVEQQQHHTAMSSLDTRAQGGAVNKLTALLTHLPISLTASGVVLRSHNPPARPGCGGTGGVTDGGTPATPI